MQKGEIGIKSENILPVIKKFLYSESEIFLRELVSNAVDATQKLQTLASIGEYKEELGDLTIRIFIDKKQGTITVSDRGIGMTAEEIDKYINQIAVSSATEFLDRYRKDSNAIIGQFGLGFYSSFIVSRKVEIYTRSYKTGTQPVKWSCEGETEYTIEEIDKTERGTDVVLYLDKSSKEYLDEQKIEGLLKKYCGFLPVKIAFGKEKEYKDGKMLDTEKDRIINETNPVWKRNPKELKEQDYLKFYRKLYPMNNDPLFYIHLNVDYPFHLTGVLYFPRIKHNLDIQKNKIQLYCNQVFVTDSVEDIVPEFLTLLHGVIDSPDIPLNVSRSYLQKDTNVKRISSHITKKVADRLKEIFASNRKQFEEKWDDLKLFIQYGMITDEKFYERAMKFYLLKNTDNSYFTFDEYKKIIKQNQTDRNDVLVYLYASNVQEQYTFIEEAKSKGYDVLLMDGQLEPHFINHLEQKEQKIRFTRVDADIPERLIPKQEIEKVELTEREQNELRGVFRGQLPQDKTFFILFEALKPEDYPVIITQSEYMRRMKDMSKLTPGTYINTLPENFNLVININHPLIQKINQNKKKDIGEELDKLQDKLDSLSSEKEKIEKSNKNKKTEEISQAEKDKIKELEDKIMELGKERDKILRTYGEKQAIVKQLIDISLLANNLLKGEELNKFIKRSIELLDN